MTRAVGILLAATVIFATACIAVVQAWGAPPSHVDSAISAWFNSLSNPVTGLSCCAEADGRVASVRDDGKGGLEALIGQQWNIAPPKWEAIPDKALLPNQTNPLGQWVVFWHPGMGILCAVRPAEV